MVGLLFVADFKSNPHMGFCSGGGQTAPSPPPPFIITNWPATTNPPLPTTQPWMWPSSKCGPSCLPGRQRFPTGGALCKAVEAIVEVTGLCQCIQRPSMWAPHPLVQSSLDPPEGGKEGSTPRGVSRLVSCFFGRSSVLLHPPPQY